jgi:hypothetical protein
MTAAKEKAPALTEALKTTLQADIKFCSGLGQFHTDKAGRALDSISWPEIVAMLTEPQNVEKAQGRWLIASTLPTRNFAEQERRGTFWALWADFDHEPKPIAEMLEFWECQTDSKNALFYSSKSATKERPKSRLIVPLAKPLSGAEWMLAAECLNDLFDGAGFYTDRASERPAQLCYLPNRGTFYDAYTLLDGESLDTLVFFAEGMTQKRAAIVAAEAEALKRHQAAEANRLAFHASGCTSAVEAFNACHDVVEVLLKAGYSQRGTHFRHPQSESGSYSASVKNGRVYSLSPNDPLHTNAGAHDAFSAWAVLCFGGDMSAAAKAVYAMLRGAA